MINYLETVISQYANSPVILALLENVNEIVDPGANLDAFYSMVLDVSTAQGFGLDIWGRIVGVSRTLEVPSNQEDLGFSEGPSGAPFGSASFYNGPRQGAFELSDDAFRLLIFVRALANISDATAQNYNKILLRLFAGRGRCYVIDQGNMKMQYTFEFFMYLYELAILQSAGVIPRPTGVEVTILQVDIPGTFGFSEAGIYQPFGYGTFGSDVLSVN